MSFAQGARRAGAGLKAEADADASTAACLGSILTAGCARKEEEP